MAEQDFNSIEVWAQVRGYEGVYEVSSLGAVRRCDRYHASPRTLKPASKRGYLQVCLSMGGVMRTFTVHRLVCEAFIGPRPVGMDINHKNGDKADNSAPNLEYVTHAENMTHADEVLNVIVPTRARGDENGSRASPENLKRGEQINTAVLTEERVLAIKEMLGSGVKQRDVAEHFSISQTQVWRIRTGVTWRHVTSFKPIST
jgi:hypothetical protein